MAEEKLDNMNETAEDGPLGVLLKSLNRVEAPNDFDLKVKKRITERKSAAPKGQGWWPLPVYVYALAIVMIAGSAFLLREFYWGNTGPMREVADSKKETVPAANNSTAIQPPQPSTEPPIDGKDVAIGDNGNNTQDRSPGNLVPAASKRKNGIDRQRPGGSMDPALGNAVQILPRGFDMNTPKKNAPPPMNDTQLSINDLINFLGMEGKFEGQDLRITSVVSQSIADKSGIKIRDILAAVDSTPVRPNTKFGGHINAKTMTMVRDGQRIQVKIGGH